MSEEEVRALQARAATGPARARLRDGARGWLWALTVCGLVESVVFVCGRIGGAW
jgi:hypothetical protein